MQSVREYSFSDVTEPRNAGLITYCSYLLGADHNVAHNLVWVGGEVTSEIGS